MKRNAQPAIPAALPRGGFAVVRQSLSVFGKLSQMWSFSASRLDCLAHAAPTIGKSYEYGNTPWQPQGFGTLVQM